MGSFSARRLADERPSDATEPEIHPRSGLDAGSAGHRVGYGDVSQFTREYKRLFGAPPMRDVGRLREAAVEGVAP